MSNSSVDQIHRPLLRERAESIAMRPVLARSLSDVLTWPRTTGSEISRRPQFSTGLRFVMKPARLVPSRNGQSADPEEP